MSLFELFFEPPTLLGLCSGIRDVQPSIHIELLVVCQPNPLKDSVVQYPNREYWTINTVPAMLDDAERRLPNTLSLLEILNPETWIVLVHFLGNPKSILLNGYALNSDELRSRLVSHGPTNPP